MFPRTLAPRAPAAVRGRPAVVPAGTCSARACLPFASRFLRSPSPVFRPGGAAPRAAACPANAPFARGAGAVPPRALRRRASLPRLRPCSGRWRSFPACGAAFGAFRLLFPCPLPAYPPKPQGLRGAGFPGRGRAREGRGSRGKSRGCAGPVGSITGQAASSARERGRARGREAGWQGRQGRAVAGARHGHRGWAGGRVHIGECVGVRGGAFPAKGAGGTGHAEGVGCCARSAGEGAVALPGAGRGPPGGAEAAVARRRRGMRGSGERARPAGGSGRQEDRAGGWDWTGGRDRAGRRGGRAARGPCGAGRSVRQVRRGAGRPRRKGLEAGAKKP